jgi:hypothetical protein
MNGRDGAGRGRGIDGLVGLHADVNERRNYDYSHELSQIIELWS